MNITLAFFNITLSPDLYGNEILKILVSVLAGGILGLEREMRGKSAGFRTLALICFGATIFTICSYLLGVQDNRDRVAANIITGVGFIGAGVIFRNNASVSGITTAASIWIAAAVGMLIGIGEYWLATISIILALFILYVFDFIQYWIDYRFQHRDYRIVFKGADQSKIFCEKLLELHLNFKYIKTLRLADQFVFYAQVSGKETALTVFNQWLLTQNNVHSFEW